MNAVAVILARAGSKGVPGKNAAMVAGRPCVAWTIDAAKAAKGVSRVVVSTDCAKVRGVATEMGVEVVERPAGLASDTARVDDAARHAVEEIEHKTPTIAEPMVGGTVGGVVILYANVPVRPAGLIDRAVEMLAKTGADSVQSYSSVGKFHPWWMARVEGASGAVKPWEGEVLNHGVYRRQELPPAYVPDGGVLVVTRRALFREVAGCGDGPHAFFGVDRRGVVNEEGSVVDIDSPTDLLVAGAMLSRAT